MKIVVNTRLLIKDKLEGIGRFTYETLKRITQEHPEDHFIFLFDRNFDEEFIFSDNITPLIITPQARHPFLFYVWFEFSVKQLLRDLKPDLFLSPDGYLSLSSDVPSIAVIHDLNFEHHPEDLGYLNRSYYKRYFPKFAHKAGRIATVSEHSKQDIVNTYKINPDKIDVVYNGAGESFRPVKEEEKKEIKKQFSNGENYFLFVGALHPRKNIARLLQAYDEFKRSTGSKTKLMVVGEKYRWTNEMREAHSKMTNGTDVIFLGHIPSEQLSKIMASALALVYIPYFEGFGIPIVEAMQCEIPVITSNVTSMPEIAGDAALLVDPFSIDSIKNAMLLIEKDDSIRTSLIQKGNKRVKDFSWEKTAGLLWKSVERTIT